MISLKTLKSQYRELRKLLIESPTAGMSTIDEHLFYIRAYNYHGHFHPHYKEWTMRRINKILELFGIDWFKGKKVLVLGDGVGYIGSFFAEMGAEVLSLEGRRTNVNIAKLRYRNLKNFKITEFNLDNDFTKFGKFDLIINMGLIEVMHDSTNLLKCCCEMSNNVIVETMVVDSNDINYFHKIARDVNMCDSELKDAAMTPTSIWIETFFKRKGFIGERITKDLDCIQHTYTWKEKNDKSFIEGRRRFWLFKK